MAQGKCTVCVSFDWDGESMWAGPGRSDSPSIISRGLYAYKVAVPRIRALLDRHGIRATFFIPGYTADLHPDLVRALYDEGHEIGHHNYYHDKMTGLSEAEERATLEGGIKALSAITGEKPLGWRCPGWGTSTRTFDLLAEYGFLYESSMMDDEVPYVMECGPKKTRIAEIPVCWELDDAPYFQFTFYPTYRSGLSSPHKVLDIWKTDFEDAYQEGHFFTITMHPQIIGRPHRLKVLDEIINFMKARPNVVFRRYIDVARDVMAGREW